MTSIPLVDLKANYRSIKDEVDKAIQDVIEDSAFIMGPYLKSFEENFARFCKVKHAIGCSSGTTAVHLALLAIGIKPGDRVITVPNTFIATTECISYVNGSIKFVDVNEDTALVDIDQMKKAVTPRTKAIVVVHLYGQMPDMQHIREIADDHDLFLIEDAAQAHAAEWYGHQPGFYGDVASYSFFPAKNLGCFGDGGAVVTNNDELAEKMRLLVNHGRVSKYEHLMEGYNYRLDALQAAILNVKLRYLHKWTELRRRHAAFYNNNLPDETKPPVEVKGAKHVYYMYVIRTTKRDKLMNYLKERGISTGIHYPVPLHLQPAYKNFGFKKGDFPVSEKLADEILSIPVYPELTEEQLNYIVDTIKQFFN
ncbi:MAG: erythromycin biosynthesis sensory transduction protein eryC1 [Thermoplasmata archaeon]|nr:MAG: erythromycin biosynthesis sensory transduction protein eryC1 [Thermoplasmata archaeon]RLF50519.1 MAG: erythromycin biosynthesis sensory transduction protein eryC1 [Thermoplasmata archaeon]